MYITMGTAVYGYISYEFLGLSALLRVVLFDLRHGPVALRLLHHQPRAT